MLKGKYINNNIKALTNSKKSLTTAVQVSICINCDLSDEPHALAKRLKNPLVIGEKISTHVCFRNFSFDPQISAAGKTVVTALLATDFNYWEELHKNTDRYIYEKKRIALEIIMALEESFPQVKGKIEEIDVVTPLTYKNYTGVYNGAFMAGIKYPKALPGLQNFHMTGQWTEINGSLPTAMLSGKGCI